MPTVSTKVTVTDTNVLVSPANEDVFLLDTQQIRWFAFRSEAPASSQLVRAGALELIRVSSLSVDPVSMDVVQWYGWGIYRQYMYAGVAELRVVVRLWPDANLIGHEVTFGFQY